MARSKTAIQKDFARAVMLGDAALAARHLEAGADLGLPDAYGLVALSCAAVYGRVDCVEMLIAAGSDIEADGSSRSVYGFRGDRALALAAREGHARCAQLLACAGADLEAKTVSGHTALMLAVRCQSVRTVQVLLEAGCDLDARDPDGWTALDSAREWCSTRECAELIQAEAQRRELAKAARVLAKVDSGKKGWI